MRSLCLPLLLFAGACASDRYLSNPGHSYFDKKDWSRAERAFAKEAKESGSNQLLFLLDQGVSLFEKREYAEAAELFLKAEDLAEIKDYTSVSEEVGTLATSENVRGYKGEDFEKVLINVYLALTYAAQGKLEDAQVEARKINLLLNKMITDGKRNYEESPFARVLSAILWEASGDWNAAYVDYKLAHELDASFPGLGDRLIALSGKLGFRDEESKWRQAYPRAPVRRWPRDEGELVVFFERGKSPRKVPRGENASLPRLEPRSYQEGALEVRVSNHDPVRTSTALDIERTSIRYLEDRIGRMAARKLIGMAVKGAIAAGVGAKSKDSDLGVLVFYALMASDRADLRSWLSLPAEIQMARVPLPAGTYKVSLRILDGSGDELRDLGEEEIDIQPGKKIFKIAR